MTRGNKVPAIKLFGKTISVLKHENGFLVDINQQNCYHQDTILNNIGLKELNEKKPLSEGEVTKNQNCFSHPISEDLKDPTTPSCIYENTKSTTLESDEANEDQSETTNNSQQEQALKRPDKIIPCPRCHSMETKFCYYNNYNVNQPRHFCKKCQRYWTNGGTMRNVPVGAGRRKSKHSSYPYLQLDGSNDSIGMHNGAIFNFGSNVRFSESMNLFCSATDPLGNSDKDRLNISGSQELLLRSNFHGFPLQVPFFTSPGFCQPGFPFWACNFSGSWPTSNSPNQSLLSSNSSSQTTLGKHSRDESLNLNSSCDLNNQEMLREKNLKGGIWVPKALRFDDPSEASKNSIIKSLGIKIEETCFMTKGGLFNDLQSNGGGREENHTVGTLSVMQANPAAMSRSLNFHETS